MPSNHTVDAEFWRLMGQAIVLSTPVIDVVAIILVIVVNFTAWISQSTASTTRLTSLIAPITAAVAAAFCLAPWLGTTHSRMFMGEAITIFAVLVIDRIMVAQCWRETLFVKTPSRAIITILILVNAYSGLYLWSAAANFSDWGALVAGISLVYLPRIFRILKDGARPSRRTNIFISILGLTSVTAILLMSLQEYQTHGEQAVFAPIGEPWRSQYFSMMLALYACLPMVWIVSRRIARLASPPETSTWPMLALPTAMAAAVPLLTTFTPHGLVLLSTSSAWLGYAYLVSRRSLTRREALDRTGTWRRAFTILALLFSFLICDRIWYFPITEHLSPAVPLIAMLIAIILGLATIYMMIFSPLAGAPRHLGMRFSLWIQRNPWRRPTVLSDATLIVSALLFGMYFWGQYQIYVYAHDIPAAGMDPGYPVPPKDGLGSVYAASWAALTYMLNLMVVCANLIYGAARVDKDN